MKIVYKFRKVFYEAALQMIFDMEECDGQVYHCADRSDEDICPPRKNEKNYTVRQI